MRATILSPAEYTGAIMQLCQDRRGVMIDMKYVTTTRVRLQPHELPCAEIVVNFFDQNEIHVARLCVVPIMN